MPAGIDNMGPGLVTQGLGDMSKDKDAMAAQAASTTKGIQDQTGDANKDATTNPPGATSARDATADGAAGAALQGRPPGH